MVQKTSLKCIQDAWVHILLDFRAWYVPESIQTQNWKTRKTSNAIRSCRANLIDDAESMLNAFRKNQNEAIEGDSAFIPIMLTATALMDQPPSVSALMNVPYFNDVLINNKQCKIRMVNTSVRAQIAFFATNPDDARSVCNQFCAYMMDDTRRKFNISFQLMPDFSDKFGAMVLENELFPSPVPMDQSNLSVVTVDATIVCSVPQVIVAENGSVTNIDQGYDPKTGIPNNNVLQNGVVTQTDIYIDNAKTDPVEHHKIADVTKVDDLTNDDKVHTYVKDDK